MTTIENEEAPPLEEEETPPETERTPCQFCSQPAVVCEQHAQGLIEQALTEDDLNRRDGASRDAERKLRASNDKTVQGDAEVIAQVIRRWWRGEEADVARAVLEILERDFG